MEPLYRLSLPVDVLSDFVSDILFVSENQSIVAPVFQHSFHELPVFLRIEEIVEILTVVVPVDNNESLHYYRPGTQSRTEGKHESSQVSYQLSPGTRTGLHNILSSQEAVQNLT